MNSNNITQTLPNITALRFFLATLVVIYHIPEFCDNRGFPHFYDAPILNKGIQAVFMFFSLSGFLIIRQLYLEKTSTQTVDLKNFFLRRMLRIFPLYYLVLFYGLFHYRILLPNLGYTFDNNYNVLSGVFFAIFFFPNIFYVYRPGGILEIMWSIGIEEQFYLFIAPLFFLLPLKRIIPFLLGFTLVYFTLFFSNQMEWLRTYQMFFYYFSFSGLCAILLEKYHFTEKLKPYKFIFFTIFILYFVTSLFDTLLPEPLYHFFSMVLFGLVICLLVDKPVFPLQNKTLIYFGKISYGIYMLHVIVMQFVGLVFPETILQLNLPNAITILLFNLLVLSTTLILAHFSYNYYESYFFKFNRKPSSKQLLKQRAQFAKIQTRKN
jgi:peptidoglycan/LPS O-acetylase OafA/YrhL